MTTKLRISVDAYLDMPEEAPYCEYVDGEVIQKAMPDAAHSVLVEMFAVELGIFRRRFGGRAGPEGRVQFVQDEDRVDYRLPDYAYWAPGSPTTVPVRDRLYFRPPTLAIEVRSPDESMREQRDKCRYFRANGVPVCWLVDPRSRTVEVFEGDIDAALLSAGETLTSVHLPGFALPIADLFATLDRLES